MPGGGGQPAGPAGSGIDSLAGVSDKPGVKNLFDLSGRHALVTGAGGGIGTAICRGFAAHGASVACLDVVQGAAESAADAVRDQESRGFPIVCDVTRPEQVSCSVARVLDEFGSLDILVNLAGRGMLKPAADIALEEWDHIVNVFLRSTFQFCREVGTHMLERGTGSIINVSSIAAQVAMGRGVAPYSAAKAGVDALTRELAVEWAKSGVRVNAIAPCRILTAPLRDQLKDPANNAEALLADWTASIPMGRLGEPEELVGPAVFLASHASSLVTGQVLTVDGGYTIT